MKLVPVYPTGKKEFYEAIVQSGGEGIMLKDCKASYTGRGRPRAMYKAKRFEEVDAFVSGMLEGDEDKGWLGLVGSLEFSCYTETGKKHPVAFCSNIPLEDRKAATVSRCCGEPVKVNDQNVGGKRVVISVQCPKCGMSPPQPAINPAWLGRVAEVRGQEYTARVFRLKHATIERWRSGVDGKSPQECKISLKDIQRRFTNAPERVDL